MQAKIFSSWDLFLDHSEVPIIVCKMTDTAIYRSNQPFRDFLEYDVSFLQKSFFSELLIAETAHKWKEQIILFKTGLGKKWESKVITKNNEIKSVELKILDVNEEDNLCLLRLKEIKSEDEKINDLRQKLEFYETILMEMPTEFAVLNSKWQYLFINRNSIKDTEFREWMIGKTDYDFCRYRNRDFSIAENRHKQYSELARTKTPKEWIDEHDTSDGGKKYILRKLFPYFSDEKLSMNFGFGIDITERIEAEKERELIIKEMTKQNAELKQFAYITSHDLKEPLRTITGFTGLLQKKYSHLFDATASEFLNFIINSADRMSNLLTSLNSFVIIDSDKIEERFVSIDMSQIIQDSLDNLKLKIMETETLIDIPSDLPTIKGHPVYLTQLFQNIIYNSMKFCDEKPVIKIDWIDFDDRIQFSIKDNGIGIPPKYQEKIFRIFNRLNKNQEGTGMGLAICQKVVQLHNGSIWLESDGKNGTTFFFDIKK